MYQTEKPSPQPRAFRKALAILLLTVAGFLSAPAIAQQTSVTTSDDGTLIIQLLVYGDDACPQTNDEEIIVCARRPESERYRIPKKLREKPLDVSGNGGSWTTHNEALEANTRFTRPNSCSAVGTGGQTGCLAALLHQYYLEKQLDKAQQK